MSVSTAPPGSPRVGRPGGTRIDALAKASGAARYAGDIEIEGLVHAALARSAVAHGRIRAVRLDAARAAPGVIAVLLASDLPIGTVGRLVRDVPVLAIDKVRFVGEPVAAVLAERREQAEAAAALVEVELDELPAVFDADQALSSADVRVHDAPWDYPGAVVTSADGVNLQSFVGHGDARAAEEALDASDVVVDEVYRTAAGHQGYLEPLACVARVAPDGTLEIWASDKSPYRLRGQLAAAMGRQLDSIVLHPVPIGGDFGGKGSATIVPLCAALAEASGRPVRLALRYSEDLTTANPRHPTRIRVRLGADGDGRLTALAVDVAADGGAYAGLKPIPSVGLHGLETVASTYRIPCIRLDARIAYTNSVPKGHMRAPGSPQATFAFESALDELALRLGVTPVDIRRRNLAGPGEASAYGAHVVEIRGLEVLEAALDGLESPEAPDGWSTGWGIGIYDRETAPGRTSMRLRKTGAGGMIAEVPFPETGTGSHTVMRNGLAQVFGIDPLLVEVVPVSTDALPYDVGVGASRVTAEVSELLAAAAAQQWGEPGGADEVLVEIEGRSGERVTSCCVQIAHVAVDSETGQVRVLEIVSALDVAEIMHPAAHRMQIEGGAVMGFGFACLEDLVLDDGQVWAANLGEFRIPSVRDVPNLRTVLVTGSRGLGVLDVKAVGELANVPTAAAVANAVAAATGARVRELPITAERVYEALRHAGAGSAAAAR